MLDEARAALVDAEKALEGFNSSVVDVMKLSVDRRRQTINETADRLNALDSPSTDLSD